MAAIGGIDIALWDIKGKAAGLPIYKLLGGSRRSVFAYAIGGDYIEDAPLTSVAKEMSGYVEMGYRAVKIKTGALGLEDELTRIRAVRDAIGPDTLFILDMNAPYGVEDCIAFANAVAPYDILWLEAPCSGIFSRPRCTPRQCLPYPACPQRTRMDAFHYRRVYRFRRLEVRPVRLDSACGLHRVAAHRPFGGAKGCPDRPSHRAAYPWPSGFRIWRSCPWRGIPWKPRPAPASRTSLQKCGRSARRLGSPE